MSYRDSEKSKIVALRDKIFKDPGYGLFKNKKYDFVLSNPKLNLWEAVRDDALKYFAQNDIKWWEGVNGNPSGHLLSSQISCINHLFYIRQKPDLALLILQSIEPSIVKAEIVDSGYVEFEFIGSKQYMKELAFIRGSKCTSVDAAMIGSNAEGIRILFLIEWKYTEVYDKKDFYCDIRAKIYDELIASIDSPFKYHYTRAYYFEPFYQMMRQTLLGYCCTKHGDYDCGDYRLVHVIPKKNEELLNTITSNYLRGSTIKDAWLDTLKRRNTYIHKSPEELLEPIQNYDDVSSLVSYLRERYWS